jgi:diguanylate cyclase (GGDEF) domain
MAGKVTLGAVDRLTAQRGHFEMVAALVRIASGLVGSRQVSYYEVTAATEGGQAPMVQDFLNPERQIAPQEMKLLLRAFRTRKTVRGTVEGRLTVVHPVQGHDGNGALLVFRVRRYLPAAHRELRKLLAIYRNFQLLHDRIERDALTGLYNRQYFGEVVARLIHPGRAYHQRRKDKEHGYWLGMLDVDYFKRVNDEHGHLIGDEVLVLFARLMRETFRYEDRLFRYGGEEFIVVLEGVSRESAFQALERFRLAVEAYPFPQGIRITVSAGFTEIQFGALPSEVIDRADRALYYAKNAGRNQICGYEDLVARGDLRQIEYPSHKNVHIWVKTGV